MNRQPYIYSLKVLKLTAIIILPIALLVGVIMLFFYRFDTQASLRVLKGKEVNVVELQKEAIIFDFKTVATDLVFLARTAHLHDIYRSSNPEEVRHVEKEFSTFSWRKGMYDQVRYLDIDGREVVRINYNNGKPVAVSGPALQNKSRRYYFKDTVKLGVDDIYISPFDLNIEHKELERPYKPIIRFGTPVFDEDGKKRGILMFNYIGMNIKRHLERLATNSIGATMLLNTEGYWLFSQNTEDEWGFLLKDRKSTTFAARYPDEWSRVKGAKSGQFQTPRGLVTFLSVRPYKWTNTPVQFSVSPEAGSLLSSQSSIEWKLVSFVDSGTLALNSGVLARRLLFTYLFLLSVIVVGAWFTAFAVSSRKAAEMARRESDARYGMVYSTSLNSILITDFSGIITEANPRTADIFGYDQDELIGIELSQLIQGKYVADFKAGISRLLEACNKNVHGSFIEFVGVRKGGGLFPVEATVSSFVIGINTFIGVTLRDITRRRLMEGNLKESEAMYRGLVTTSQNLIWRCDNGGLFTYLNPAWEKTLGYTCLEMLGKSFSDFQSPDAATFDLKVFLESGDSAEVSGHEILCRSKSAQDVYLVFYALPMLDKEGTVVGRQGTANDITEHKRLEKGLRTLSHAIEQIPTSVIITDVVGVIEYVNPKFTEDLGYTLSEVFGHNISMLNSNLQPESFYSDIRAGVLGGIVWQGNVSYRKKNEETVWELITVSSILGIDGNTTHLLVVKVDDTERKRAEEALKKSEASLAVAQRIAHVGNWDWDIASNVVIWSDEAFRIYGFEPHSVKADYGLFMGVVHPDDRVMIERRIREALSNARAYRVEHRIVRADGVERVVQENGEVEFDENGTPVSMIGTVSDVTEHNRLETEVLKAQKLESIGLLAGGIAHDFNNILTAVLGNISMAKISLSPEDTVWKRLAEAEKATEQARGLTQHLLTFSKGGAPVKSVVELGSVVRDASLFALRGSNVKFTYSVAENLWPVEADEGQIVQVINNLIINADQSMPDGGEIRLECVNVELDAGAVSQLGPGKYIRITVKDYGCGIGQESMLKIFDPYYTTKKRGSGLGLAATYSIIEKHGGGIEVDSMPGVGTTFKVYLKAANEPVVERGSGDPVPVKGTGRVLVMDDEEGIRELLTEMLAYLGYEVETVKDGAGAVESYRSALVNGIGFDAVIMDLTIPGGIGGREAIKELLEIDPGARAIVSSGYSNDPVMAEYERYGFSGVVAKPYMIGKLSLVLYDVIGNV